MAQTQVIVSSSLVFMNHKELLGFAQLHGDFNRRKEYSAEYVAFKALTPYVSFACSRKMQQLHPAASALSQSHQAPFSAQLPWPASYEVDFALHVVSPSLNTTFWQAASQRQHLSK